MGDCFETQCGLLSRIERLEREVSTVQCCSTRRSSFEDLCSRYGDFASEKEWLEHFGVVFDGTWQRRRSNQ